jgi:hypothetical protein
MSVMLFEGRDSKYVEWLVTNPHKFVLNGNYPSQFGLFHLHRADCPTIAMIHAGKRWTTSPKICGTRVEVLNWKANCRPGAELFGCSTCLTEVN